ncbi:MAG: hypothetical protein KDA87_00570 [Planctomycetales bacterium]|nr:hypothetical protein [Planctomycetales bacterium]
MRRTSFTQKLRNLFADRLPSSDLEDSADAIVHGIERITTIAPESSLVYQNVVAQRLRDMAAQVGSLRDGRILFSSTETWRTVYEDVLQSCQTRRYLSVALIRSDDYWRDHPGENSLDFNFRLVNHGFYVHRLFVIDDFFWPKTARTPSQELHHWILKQHFAGIEVSLVRMADLEQDAPLACDLGIYGTDAVGWQTTDFEGRSVRYEISFNARDVVEAEVRWKQLLLYAESLSESSAK